MKSESWLLFHWSLSKECLIFSIWNFVMKFCRMSIAALAFLWLVHTGNSAANAPCHFYLCLISVMSKSVSDPVTTTCSSNSTDFSIVKVVHYSCFLVMLFHDLPAIPTAYRTQLELYLLPSMLHMIFLTSSFLFSIYKFLTIPWSNGSSFGQ